MTEYVLGKFSTEEEKLLPEITLRAARAIMTWVEEGTEKAMSVYNGLVPSLRIEKKQR
jgi:peptidyl-tRNA hydrolase